MNKSCDIKTRLLEVSVIVISVLGFMFCVYAAKGVYPFGEGTVSYSDMSQQMIPFYYYLYDILHGSELPYFTWQVGTGSNMLGVMSQFSMLSPFNLLFYFTSRENVLNYVNIVVVIKTVFVALAMYMYSYSFKVKSYIKVLASVLYALGAGTIIYYVLGYNMDIAILLPVIMTGMRKIKEEKKTWLFILSMTACLAVNVYYAFMVVIFVVISSALQFLLLDDKETRGRSAYLIICSLITSVLMSAVVWLPSIVCISNSARLGGGMSLFDTYMTALKSSQSDVYMKSMMVVNITFFVAVILSSPLVSKIKKQKVFDRLNVYGLVLLGIMLLSVIVPATELLWHGGSRMGWPVRFIFVIAFAFADFYLRVSEKNEEANQKDGESNAGKPVPLAIKVIAGIVCAIVSGVLVFKFSVKYIIEIYNGINNIQRDTLVFTLILFVVYMIILCVVKNKYRGMVLVLAVCVEISFNISMWIAPVLQEPNASVGYIEQAAEVFEGFEPESRLDRVKDSKVSLNSNYAFVGGVNSVANFIHTVDGDVLSYMKELGYPSAWTRILDNSGTLLSDSMINMKYILEDGKIVKNPYTLPYVTSVSNIQQPAEEYNRFERLNNIYKGISGHDKKLFEIADDKVINENVSLNITGNKVVYMYADNAGALSVKVNDEYIYVPDLNNAENTVYQALFNNNIISLGEYSDETINILFEGENVAYEQIRLAIMDIDMFTEDLARINEASKEKLTHFNVSKGGLSFGYKSAEQEILMLPIVLSDGWKVKVNGKKADIIPLYGGMAGTEVAAGQNEVSVYFVPKGIIAGLVMTIIGIILVIAVRVVNKKISDKPKLKKISYIIYVAGAAILGIALYVVPFAAMILF